MAWNLDFLSGNVFKQTCWLSQKRFSFIVLSSWTQRSGADLSRIMLISWRALFPTAGLEAREKFK